MSNIEEETLQSMLQMSLERHAGIDPFRYNPLFNVKFSLLRSPILCIDMAQLL